MTLEYRAFRADGVSEDDEGTISGLIAPYNVRTQIGSEKYGFKEDIAPGTFSKSLRERDIVALDNHDAHRPLARTSAGTLTLTDSPKEGLRGKALPPDTTYAQDLLKNVRAKNYGGWSFGFEVVKDEWRDDDGKPSDRYEGTHRTLREVKLIEVSPVTFPAYPSTSIQARDSLLAEREARAREAGDGQDGDKHQPPGDDLLDQAAALLSAYNALPADQREALPEEIRTAISAMNSAAEGREDQEPEPATPEPEADDDKALDEFRAAKARALAAEYAELSIN